MMRTAADQGRGRLADWERRRPDNFFTADRNLTNVLRRHLGHDRLQNELEGLERFGDESARIIDAAARETNLPGNLPELRRYDGIGRRTEQIVFHPDYHRIGERVYRTGVMSGYLRPGEERLQLAFVYLLSQNGEAGHACPLACTAGLIRFLQAVGSKPLQRRFLPRLLDPDYSTHFIGAQFLTEVQGGSDVGSNALRAEPEEHGRYLLHGEKWFCSVIDADLFLVTARPDGGAEGTAGLAAFVVPRNLDDGTLNGFHIRRLKDKLGTRSMASAEVDFRGALAYPAGPLEDGFKNVVEIVLSTSRSYNAICCAGFMRRAEMEATRYAASRTAFGSPIVEFPPVQETLARIKVEARAALASTYELIAMRDCAANQSLTPGREQALRALTLMNKYVTSLRNTEVLRDAMELLGGNAAIEDFSVLPRLYRDAYVLEAWEGTHNVLAAQLLRDFGRYRIHEGLIEWLHDSLRGDDTDATRDSARLLESALTDGVDHLRRVLSADPASAALDGRRLSERLMVVAQGLCLLNEARWAESNGCSSDQPTVAEHFVRTRVLGQEAAQDPGRLDRLRRLASVE